MIITRIRNTFIGIGLFIVALFVISLFFDRDYIINEQIRINAPVDSVYKLVSECRYWKWMGLESNDTAYKYEILKDSTGHDSSVVMKGPLVNINFRAEYSKPNELVYIHTFTADGEFNMDAYVVMHTEGNQTLVNWVDSTDVGYNPIARFVLKSRKQTTTDGARQNLARLKKLAETGE